MPCWLRRHSMLMLPLSAAAYAASFSLISLLFFRCLLSRLIFGFRQTLADFAGFRCCHYCRHALTWLLTPFSMLRFAMSLMPAFADAKCFTSLDIELPLNISFAFSLMPARPPFAVFCWLPDFSCFQRDATLRRYVFASRAAAFACYGHASFLRPRLRDHCFFAELRQISSFISIRLRRRFD